MKFELNDYHRNISDQELIQDVQDVAKSLGKDTLTGSEYSLHGKYYDSTLRRRFGSWKKVLEACNLETVGHNFKCNISNEEMITDLKRVAGIVNLESPTRESYDKYGKYHSATLCRKYGSWNNVLKFAGMKLNLNRKMSNDDMFEEIERVWIIVGKQPTATDMKSGISKYSLNSYVRRFGGWRKALEAFVDFINSDTTTLTGEGAENKNTQTVTCSLSENNEYHKTPRDINLRLRFKVLQRDNFKCCACGASPAKDPAVELHVDHIMPWAKGGETVFENLQTLCSKCNLGKSDM